MADVLRAAPPAPYSDAHSTSDEEEDEVGDLQPAAPPPNFNRVRRTSVSAESITPTALGADYQKIVVPKTDEQRVRIETSIKNNFLFRSLDEEQHTDVVNAMVERKVAAGEVGSGRWTLNDGDLSNCGASGYHRAGRGGRLFLRG